MDTDRDLPATTAGTPTHDMAHSLTGNLWWLLPPAPALCYPLTVKALFESGKLLHRVSGPGDAVAWLAIVVSVGFVYSVPAVGISVAYLLGRDERTSSSELLARRLAHLAVASPPLFVLIGVVFYLMHAPNGDSVFWWIPWLQQRGRCAGLSYRGTLLFSDSYWPFSSGENLGTSVTAIAETEGSVQIFIADNPRAVSRAAVQTLLRVARFSAKWITSGLPFITGQYSDSLF
jgi:hypothetical protein